jgi:WD40 repeat protein
MWPLLARALTGAPCTSTDLDWLIDAAGFYIVESTSDDGRRSAYRLYHEALAEHLRAGRDDPAADQAVIVDALTGHAPRLADGRPDWGLAHPYTRANLVTHAAGTDRLDPLITDPRFLLAANRSSLLAALPSAKTAQARAYADAYRRADARLHVSYGDERAAYLQLAARCGRATQLADAISADGLPLAWATDWASWRLQPPHRTFTGHAGEVNAVAVGLLDGRTVVVSGSGDRTVRVWDAATGDLAVGPLTGHAGEVNAVAVGQLGGRTVVVSGSDDGTVRVWDAAVGEPLGGPLTGHTDWINAVTIAQLGGRTVVVSGSRDRTVRIWTTYDLLGRYGRAEVLPGKIDLAASVLGIAFAAPSRLMVATELGVVSLRMQ